MPGHSLRLLRLDSVASTQEEGRKAVRAGCPSGTVVLAEEQTAGRGREGRAWESARGLGLWFTIVHRSKRAKNEWPALTVVSAVALCEALETIGLEPRTRWPNDLLLSGRKVSGILADTEEDAILIGVGLNLSHEADDFSPMLREIATSIGLEARKAGIVHPGREGFTSSILASIDHHLQEFETSGASIALASFWSRSIERSRRLAVLLPSGNLVEGIATGLGEIGQLLVETANGLVALPGGAVIWREGK
jgi:BirA family transcriptional regulator, biotin operon repressor / biotin---[acetyl-CoA-carboxylase] ligase